MNHLRFSPADYRAVAAARSRLDLFGHDLPTFRLALALSLADHSPELAERIRRLTDPEARVLREHLQGEQRESAQRRFGPDEWSALVLASRCLPLSARFARPLQKLLVRYFRDSAPGLARKVGRMNSAQFDRLLDQVRTGRRESA